MKKIFKKILIPIFFLVPLFTFVLISPSSYAAPNDGGYPGATNNTQPSNGGQTSGNNQSNGTGNCDDLFFGLKPWNCDVTTDGNGNIQITNEDELKSAITKITINVLADLTIIAAYLVLGFVIYGGYQYMFSEGDPGKAANGKKTLLHAFIGLAIVLTANIILSTIRIALLGQNGSLVPNTNVDTNSMVTNLIQWVIGIAGLVAAIFLIIGGISYITSSGDANKLQKAKNTILYALIGLIIVALAEVGTAFVSNLIRESQKSQSTAQVTIRKDIKS